MEGGSMQWSVDNGSSHRYSSLDEALLVAKNELLALHADFVLRPTYVPAVRCSSRGCSCYRRPCVLGWRNEYRVVGEPEYTSIPPNEENWAVAVATYRLEMRWWRQETERHTLEVDGVTWHRDELVRREESDWLAEVGGLPLKREKHVLVRGSPEDGPSCK